MTSMKFALTMREWAEVGGQGTVLQHQTDAFAKERRSCSKCGSLRALHDDGGRVIETLFGRFTVKSPRLRQCSCLAADAKNTQLLSPVAELLPDRATPEFMRLQAELGSRHSFREAAKRVNARCTELYTYLSSNFHALVDHGYRHRNGRAISSSRAEGCVDDIGNTRMGKKRRMRWSPQGAHRVAVTRAAVLNGRLSVSKLAA